MIGFNRRFDPNFAILKKALAAGEIGKAELLSITSFDPSPPPLTYVKASGGLFRDMMIHDFDMVSWIMREPPDKVTAVATSIVDPRIGEAGDVDTAVATLHFADGRIAVIKTAGGRYMATTRGSSCWVRKDYLRPATFSKARFRSRRGQS